LRKIAIYTLLAIYIGCSDKNKTDYDTVERTIEIIQREDPIDLDIFYGYDTFVNQEARKLNNLGVELIKQNKYKAAEKEFIAAFRLEPKNPTILNNLGNIYREIGTEKMALEYYTDALIVSDSTYINAAYNMGISYYSIEDYEKSENILNYVLKKTDDKVWKMLAKYTLSKVYVNQKKCSEATEIYQKIKSDLNNYPKFECNQEKFEEKLKNCVQQRIKKIA
jgi:tetratricopeptide (TPR) repeat protein